MNHVIGLCCAAALVATAAHERPPSICDNTAALLMARAMILAAPILLTDDNMFINDGEQLRAFVASNRSYFVKGGAAIRCAAVAGPRIARQSLATYDPHAYDRVMSNAPVEIAEHAQEIASRINESSSYMLELGQELTWLATVLPSVADGDMRPFFETGYPIRNDKRRLLLQVWPAVQMMCSMPGSDCREVLAMAMPMIRQQLDENAYGMAYAMVMLAG